MTTRPKTRLRKPADDLLAAEALKRFQTAYADQTKHRQDSLAELRRAAAAERKELETLTKK